MLTDVKDRAGGHCGEERSPSHDGLEHTFELSTLCEWKLETVAVRQRMTHQFVPVTQ